MANCIENSPDTPPPEAVVTAKVESPTEDKLLYYPSSMGHACLSDGKQPTWLTVGSMFDNEKVCKGFYFSYAIFITFDRY